MYLVLVLFPIIDVPKPLMFTAKIGGFILAWQFAAVGLFYAYRRRSQAHPAADPADEPAAPSR